MPVARPFFALVCCACLIMAGSVRAAEDPVKPDKPADPVAAFEARVLKSETVPGGTLPYRLLTPAGYDPKAADAYPLLLLLHGAGERGSDNKAQLKWGGAEAANDLQAAGKCFVIAPQCPAGKQWVNTPWSKGSYGTDAVPASDQMKMALEAVDRAMKEFRVDPARVYVMGLSMGGYGTWDAIARRPDFFAAAVPICGAGDPKSAEKLKAAGVAVWAFHGGADTVVPTQGSRDMAEALKKAGYVEPQFKYTEFPGVGHNAWSPTWKTKGLWEWVLAQKRKPATKG
ncbi:MAG TPA: prolyl oligopeptidase family serine peptidase [Humisphaera sp.]